MISIHGRFFVIIALAWAAILSSDSRARADKNWNTAVPDGSWSVPTNWMENALPVSDDNVFISFNDASNHDITYDAPALFSNNESILIQNQGAGTATLLISSSIDLTVGSISVGPTGNGAITHSLGTVAASGDLTLAEQTSGRAIYTLSGGWLGVTGTTRIGDAGHGTLSHTSSGVGFSETIFGTGTLSVGHSSEGFGTYLLNGVLYMPTS